MNDFVFSNLKINIFIIFLKSKKINIFITHLYASRITRNYNTFWYCSEKVLILYYLPMMNSHRTYSPLTIYVFPSFLILDHLWCYPNSVSRICLPATNSVSPTNKGFYCIMKTYLLTIGYSDKSKTSFCPHNQFIDETCYLKVDICNTDFQFSYRCLC